MEVLGPDAERTERMVLRPLAERDRSAFVEAVRASRAMLDRWLPIHEPGESDSELFERQLALTREGERTGRALRRVGVLADGTIAGAWNLVRIERGLEWEADCNWWVASGLAGKGLGGEGARWLIAKSFADLPAGLGLHQVVAAVSPDNAASKALLGKLGFAPKRGVRISSTIGGRVANDEVWTITPESIALDR